jgi:hypothetical protein
MAVLYRPADASPEALGYRVRRAPDDTNLLDPGHAHWGPAARVAWGPGPYNTRFRALWNDAALWVRFDCDDRDPWHTLTGRDAPLWEEEVVELFLQPAGLSCYLELEISPSNTVCDLRVDSGWPDLQGDITWNLAGLATEVRHERPGPAGEVRWTATARLPWRGVADLAPAAPARIPPEPGDAWRFNVFRIKRPGGPAHPERDALYAAWSVPEGPSFHVPAAFRPLVFE